MTDWVERIGSVRFSPVRLGEGYDMDQIDYLLDLLEAAAAQGEPLGPILEGVEVNQVRLREGYSIPEVDAFFAEVRASGGEPARPDPVQRADQVQAPTRVQETEAAPAPAPEPTPPPTPAAPAKKGFFARLFGA